MVKNLPANAGDVRKTGSIPGRGRSPGEDLLEWLPTPIFLPGKSHGQRSLVGYSPRGHKKSDITVNKQQQQHHQQQKTSWHLHELIKYLPKEKCSNGSSKWHRKSKQWIG